MPSRLANLLGAYRVYLDTVADLGTDRAALQQARSAARLARTNAQASVDRARSEPGASAEQVELGRSVLANSHRLVRSVLTIDALRPRLREAGALPELDRLFELVSTGLAAAEQSLRSGEPVERGPSVRATQGELAARLMAPDEGGSLPAEAAGALVYATDRLANSTDTLIAVLAEQPAPLN
jgi:uncharacterized membrane protein YccC